MRLQKFQRDAASQAKVFRLVDNTHATAAKLLNDAVVSNVSPIIRWRPVVCRCAMLRLSVRPSQFQLPSWGQAESSVATLATKMQGPSLTKNVRSG
jgi:hypothetical protein